ncbi:hypothetical protein V0M98_32785 (plasmid) [Pseudomonas silesiensis]|uniref:hypothetical protein n=1 Tax=Pseudomonas silesiensis TaxID=1853130 RepID=UPI0030D369D2
MTFEYAHKIKGSDGLEATVTLYRVDKTTYSSASNRLHFDCVGGDQFEAKVSPSQLKSRFVDKLINAFRFHPQWREHFRVFTHAHPVTELHYMNGLIGSVDLKLQPYVQALNDRGFPTMASCEGDAHPMGRPPFIKFVGAIPEALETVWNRLDWVNLDRTVIPLSIHGFTHEYRAIFLLILDDWLHDDLDMSAKRYRLSRSDLPLIPPFPPVNEPELKAHQKVVAKRAKRLNLKGSKASTFDDLVKLRSGRDSYTNMKLPALLEALAGDPEVAHLQRLIKSTPDLQRALRWRLRGLTLEIILRKYEVDQVLSRHAELKKQARTLPTTEA